MKINDRVLIIDKNHKDCGQIGTITNKYPIDHSVCICVVKVGLNNVQHIRENNLTTLAKDGDEYTLWQEELDIQEGDTIEILCSIPSWEGGWGTTWQSEMDVAIGKKFKVQEVNDTLGYSIDIDGNNTTFWFPFYVARKVEQKQEELEIYDPDNFKKNNEVTLTNLLSTVPLSIEEREDIFLFFNTEYELHDDIPLEKRMDFAKRYARLWWLKSKNFIIEKNTTSCGTWYIDTKTKMYYQVCALDNVVFLVNRDTGKVLNEGVLVDDIYCISEDSFKTIAPNVYNTLERINMTFQRL